MYKLMVVDGDKLVRQTIQTIIKERNIPLSYAAEATDGVEALLKARKVKPDVVIMEINIPKFDGLNTAEKIKEFLPQCQVIFISAHKEFEYVRQALRIGAFDYLLKPVQPGEFEEVCCKLTEILGINEQEELEFEREKVELASTQLFIRKVLLSGCFSGSNELRNQFHEFFVSLKCGVLMVLSSHAINLDKLIVHNIIGMLKGNLYLCPVPLNPNQIVVFFGQKYGQSKLTTTVLKKYGYRLMEQVALKTGIELNIGIGKIYKDLSKLRKSYLEACDALNLAEFLRMNGVLLTIEECEKFYKDLSNYLLDREKKLIDMILRKKHDDAIICIHDIFNDFQPRLESNLIWEKVFCLEILAVLLRAARKANVNSEELSQINSALTNELVDMTDLGKRLWVEWLEHCVDRIIALIANNEKASVQRLIKEIKEYIENNLNKSITLKDISELTHYNPQYFSRAFKKEIGMTVIEYLTHRRIEKAKMLLKKERLPVRLVAKKVGFSDVAYFSRVFRKVVGVKPSEFREKSG
ncbi:two component transcriptional regulator, AraC family [Thermincola ferriacetica]|uniref:Stage 0 sporulation protein A homolog n=1 Tax=Thermincola ferriacetica TaxID=281456 RepID=A0A0L6W3Y4_9FIRM|nr:response regulator [Thermincola ferriacetica]KNZ69799.1 two component transcriptional regulator, AraC family [Thermincola ferriacetica]